METENLACQCGGSEYMDCECSAFSYKNCSCEECHCKDCKCNSDEEIAKFEAQRGPEIGYIFGPTWQSSETKPRTIGMKQPRKNPT